VDETTQYQEEDKEAVRLSEFKQLRIWLCWRYEIKNKNDRPTKVPYGADGIAISTTQNYISPWVTFEEASRAYEELGFVGVGFVIPKGFGGIDSDHLKECDPINSDLTEHFQTYAENSPSKAGRHWIFKCDTSYISNQDGKLDSCYYCKNPNNDLEIYFGGMTNRFLTLTGDVVSDFQIVDCTKATHWFLDKYMLRPALPDTPDIVPHAYLTIEQGLQRRLHLKTVKNSARYGTAIPRIISHRPRRICTLPEDWLSGLAVTTT
jgi:putative DNA primase/helicase